MTNDNLGELARLRAKLATIDARRRAVIAARDRAIRASLDAGESLREIGAAAGLSHGGIAKIRDRAD